MHTHWSHYLLYTFASVKLQCLPLCTTTTFWRYLIWILPTSQPARSMDVSISLASCWVLDMQGRPGHAAAAPAAPRGRGVRNLFPRLTCNLPFYPSLAATAAATAPLHHCTGETTQAAAGSYRPVISWSLPYHICILVPTLSLAAVPHRSQSHQTGSLLTITIFACSAQREAELGRSQFVGRWNYYFSRPTDTPAPAGCQCSAPSGSKIKPAENIRQTSGLISFFSLRRRVAYAIKL